MASQEYKGTNFTILRARVNLVVKTAGIENVVYETYEITA